MSQQQWNDDMQKKSGTPNQDQSHSGAPGMGNKGGNRPDSQGQDQHTSGQPGSQSEQDQHTSGRQPGSNQHQQGQQGQRDQGQKNDRNSGSDYLQGGDQGRGGSAMGDDSDDMDVELGSEKMDRSLGGDRDANLGMGRSDSGRDSQQGGRDQRQTDNRRDQDSNL